VRAVVQRVVRARVSVEEQTIGEIGEGLLVLVGVAHTDTATDAHALARKIHGLRILRGELGLVDVPAPAAMVVSQFTLHGDARKGRRPTWAAAATGDAAEPLVAEVVTHLRSLGVRVATGRFGADMQVESVNDGPITVLLGVPPD
jgi:D-tyrosyl-tRNA(Tyr) deacylase